MSAAPNFINDSVKVCTLLLVWFNLWVLLGLLSPYSTFHYNKLQLTLVTSSIVFLQTQSSALGGPIYKNARQRVEMFIKFGQMKI